MADNLIAPIFAQQSICESNRTMRTFDARDFTRHLRIGIGLDRSNPFVQPAMFTKNQI